MISELKGKTVPVKLWARVEEIESQALDQLRNVASLPWVAHHVAVMPDVHYGKGATVGSVIAMRGAVAPAAVGVDIGCGMAAVKTNLQAKKLPDLFWCGNDAEQQYTSQGLLVDWSSKIKDGDGDFKADKFVGSAMENWKTAAPAPTSTPS